MNEKIQFKQQRELGGILSDTFKFLRHNGKQLFGLVLLIAGPALLILVLAYVYYMQTVFGNFGSMAPNPIFTPGGFGLSMFLALLLLILAGVVFYALLYGTVLHFIESYIKNDGTVLKGEVTAGVRKNFWGLLGLSLLVALMVGIGLVICFLPGIYLGVALACVYAIYVFEKRDVMDSISYSFELIKGEWWITFATFLVIFLLYYFVLMIFQMPQYIYFFIKGFSMSQNMSSDPMEMFDWGYIVLSAIGIIAQYLLFTIIVISTAFVYYNLNERKNFTGTMEAIDSIGKKE